MSYTEDTMMTSAWYLCIRYDINGESCLVLDLKPMIPILMLIWLWYHSNVNMIPKYLT